MTMYMFRYFKEGVEKSNYYIEQSFQQALNKFRNSFNASSEIPLHFEVYERIYTQK